MCNKELRNCIVEGCAHPRTRSGLCRRHLIRLLKRGDVHYEQPGGDKRTRVPGLLSMPLRERIMRGIKVTSGCWEWRGAKTAAGYGRLSYRHKYIYAHRAMWEAENGPIPEGYEVCHSCDNPACCNPAHLWLGTHKENIHDAIRKGRHAFGKQHPKHGRFPKLVGSRNPRSTITDEQAREVYRLRRLGLGPKAIQEKTGLRPGVVNGILYMGSWKHVA